MSWFHYLFTVLGAVSSIVCILVVFTKSKNIPFMPLEAKAQARVESKELLTIRWASVAVTLVFITMMIGLWWQIPQDDRYINNFGWIISAVGTLSSVLSALLILLALGMRAGIDNETVRLREEHGILYTSKEAVLFQQHHLPEVRQDYIN